VSYIIDTSPIFAGRRKNRQGFIEPAEGACARTRLITGRILTVHLADLAAYMFGGALRKQGRQGAGAARYRHGFHGEFPSPSRGEVGPGGDPQKQLGLYKRWLGNLGATFPTTMVTRWSGWVTPDTFENGPRSPEVLLGQQKYGRRLHLFLGFHPREAATHPARDRFSAKEKHPASCSHSGPRTIRPKKPWLRKWRHQPGRI